jgi:1,4-dihydroxy-2-naphthoate polyprenyltransferase
MSAIATEPQLNALSNPIKRYVMASRPAFLTATLAACLLGFASASFSGIHIQWPMVLMTLVLTALLHAAVNVLNDYCDALNGTDNINVERVYPFTGGSRFIQNQVLSLKQTANFAYILLAIVIIGGIGLITIVGSGLLLIGVFGVFLGWAYSAPPLRLNSRGLGELAVFLGFLGVVVGADFVQRGAFSLEPILLGLPYALLVTNLLFVNQFPDFKADAAVGKRHLVVVLTPESAVYIYPFLIVIALFWLLSLVVASSLPVWCLLSALPMLLSFRAAWILKRFAKMPVQLRPAIQLTIVAMLSHALILSIILFLGIK